MVLKLAWCKVAVLAEGCICKGFEIAQGGLDINRATDFPYVYLFAQAIFYGFKISARNALKTPKVHK